MKALFEKAYHRALRPLLTRCYQYLTYTTYDKAFGAALRNWQPDVIHAHDGVTLPTAARAAKDLGAKLVFDSHELEAHRSPPLSRLRRMQVEWVEGKFLPKADKVMTCTERAADYLSSSYKIQRPVVVFNAQPLKVQNVPAVWDKRDRTDLRWDTRIHPKDFIFVFTGNLTLHRGLELAIIALGMLQGYKAPGTTYERKYHLVCVGKVQAKQDVALTRLAKVHGVSNRFHILPPVAPHRVWEYIRSANASIIPIRPVSLSYEMAMPNKLFEATLAGLPILASDLVEMGPYVRDNGLGLTFDPNDPEDCLRAMIELINDYPKFIRTPEHQAELATKFSWEAQEKKLLAMYDEMLSK